MENFNKVIRLDVFISKNVISLDRGRVISSNDLNIILDILNVM